MVFVVISGVESQWQLSKRIPDGDVQRPGEVARVAPGQQPAGRRARVSANALGRAAIPGAGRQQNRHGARQLFRRTRLAPLAQHQQFAGAARGARRRAQGARRPQALQVRRQRGARTHRQIHFLHGRGQNPAGLEFKYRNICFISDKLNGDDFLDI